MFSFLYPYEKQLGILKESISDLHLNEIIDYLSPNKLENDFITNLLTDFENNEKNIYYRQELITDFINFPYLYNDLEGFFNHFTSIDYMYKNVKKEIITISKAFKSFNPQKYEYSGEILRRYANIILDLLRCYKDLDKTLTTYSFTSSALLSFKEEISKRVKNEAFRELIELMKQIILSSGNYDILIKIDDKLRTNDASLIYNYEKQPIAKFWVKKGISRKERMLDLTNRSYFEFDYYLSISTIKAINIISDIYEDYYGIVCEGNKTLMFINFALKYKSLLKELNMPCTFPVFSPNEFIINNLYDPYLGVKGKLEFNKVIAVSPNNIEIDKNNGTVLVVGENNTGKTVFTRSIGINQIFAQAGLFSSSESSTLPILSKILTCYASKESHMGDGGRFETEVRALSKIFEEANDKTLVIVNEIFQSTSALEGTKALFDVLCFLTNKNILSICVSHFLDLQYEKENFENETKKRLKLMHTEVKNNNYRIYEIK